MKFKILYDSQCPLCIREMTALKLADKNDCFDFLDIFDSHTFNYLQESPSLQKIDFKLSNKVLIGIDEQNRVYYGLDVTYQIWKRVGKGFWIAPLRWPGIKLIADWSYKLFARHRYKISKWLTGQERCARCKL